MKMKYMMILLAASFILILSIGAISATEEGNNTITLEENTANEVINTNQGDITDLKSVETNYDELKATNENSTTPTTTTTSTNATKTTVKKTTVNTPTTQFIFKRSSQFKIIIKDKQTNKTIKNLKISFKIKDGKKYKTYTLKTNNKGIATFTTKKLSLGYHKFIITSKDSRYKVSKKDKLFIGNLFIDTVKRNGNKKLKNGDIIRTFVQNKNGELGKGVYATASYGGGNNPSKATKDPKYTQIYYAKFYFKNKKTGKPLIVKSSSHFEYKGEIYRGLAHADLIKDATHIKTKIYYLKYK